MILQTEAFKAYIDHFNANDEETVIQAIDNSSAWDWLSSNMPLFECPDKTIEETYYFRWWVYRKHLKKTADGYIVTEFHPTVPWAGKHNSINCAVGHHLNEGRWLKNSADFLKDYILFWFRGGGSIRSYSSWIVDAVWNYVKVSGDFAFAIELLPDFIAHYRAWITSHLNGSGLFWSHDDRDAMELSISGSGLRPTLNSYLYADAAAISKIAGLAGKQEVREEFEGHARRLKELIQTKLWDPHDEFFKVIPLAAPKSDAAVWDFEKMDRSTNVREQIGYIPWYFHLPDQGYEAAWKQLLDTEGFSAPYGPTTAERRHPRFMFEHAHECLWNGPSWPFATSQTLTAMANLLNDYCQTYINQEDYLQLLRTYAASHYRLCEDGSRVCWLDENLDPFTGEWLSRRILESWGWRENKGGRERGKDYNHSTFNDLVISGLVGIRPREDGVLEVRPLVPVNSWDYFCLDKLDYRGHTVTVFYDRDGSQYGKGPGLHVFVDGIECGLGELGGPPLEIPLNAAKRKF
ncbi:MGH1-like glycoside hydrolase domain-containing protein [Paenibacillus sp. YN15]|uniref:MGH1-like glycoside hydrolase domain-containing protein n=1 Tax=Paenibacillus sp. YN15 TaxID=1742774 RepID=UPI0015EC9F57|nr:glycosyl hydrolase family 65 protein [Paenibacillus sp. YN15]